MPISESRYVNITSGIGAADNVATRNLGGLVVTNNTLAPTGTLLSFQTAAQVLAYFGSASEEYARAQFYFGWVSKNITQAPQISFFFWNNDAATGSLIFGAAATYSLATFTAITSGSLNLTLGGVTHQLTSINLSAAGSLSAVAADLQTAIRAYSAGGVAWTGATVTFDAVRGGFDLVSGTTGVDTVSVAVASSGTDLGAPLGWITGAIYSNGTAAQTITTALTNLIQSNNNFGSFCFSYSLAVTLATVEAAANWNNSTSPNNMFMFSAAVIPSNASSWQAGLAAIGGTSLTLVAALAADANGAFHEMMPMMILAATVYTNRNSVQNNMYQVFDAVPTVTTDAQANIYDPLLINYYGVTQTAGVLYAFYQRGVMQGLPVNPSDQNVYANEIWFKDAIAAQVLTTLLSLSQVPANNIGQAILTNAIQSIISQALFNGTISPGKTLTINDQLYITQITGSANAWMQVASAGYWLGVVIQPYTAQGGAQQWEAVYTLVYSKDDTIRLVNGSNILI